MPTTYAIPNGATVMSASTWTGNGASTLTITNGGNNPTGVTFQPDLVWAKLINGTASHNLYDSVRGTGKVLYSDLADPEGTNNTYGYLNAFNSNGFGATAGGTSIAYFNANLSTYVAWQWQAGQGTTSSNTSGSITSTVSVNTTAGFSVVRYTGTGSNATVGHGLGVAPSMIICKNLDISRSWSAYHASLGNTKNILLNSTGGANTSSTYWNNTSPTTSVFSVGSDEGANESTKRIVAYCWSAVAGYSAFGSYAGNVSTDGPFVYLGFRPRFVLIKRTDTTSYDWVIYDSSRNTYNAVTLNIDPNSPAAQTNTGSNGMDFLSNGFKIRDTSAFWNASGGTYIYAAFAENPFKYANAR